MGDVDNALEDTESAGKQLANALEAQFEAIDAAITETKATADVLATALGPELAAKVDSSVLVQEFQRLGLTLDEIKADADSLAAALKSADDVSLKHLGDSAGATDTKMRGLRDSSDQSRSVLANLAGNSAQDLGEVTGVAGSAGVAIGQLAEYATEGNISLRNLAGVAGPMALAVVAIGAIGSMTKAAGERAARAEEQVKAFTGALEDVDDATSAVRNLADQMTEFDADARTAWGGFVEGVAGAAKGIPLVGSLIGDAGQNIANVIPTFNELGIKARDIGEAAKTGGSAWDELQVSLWAAQEAGQITSAEYSAASQVLDGFRDSAEASGQMSEFLGDTTAEVGKAAEVTTTSLEKLETRQQAAADAAERHAQRLLEQIDALHESIDAQRGAADSSIAATDAQDDYIDAIEESTRVQGDAEASADDVRDAIKGERDAMLASADAAVQLADDQAKANGTIRTAEQRVLDFNTSLMNNAKFATPAARTAAYDYLIQLNDIPDTVATEIRADVAAGRLAEADRKINDASRTRQAAIVADAKGLDSVERQLNWLARDRWSTIRVRGGPSGGNEMQAAATGGRQAGGTTLVGEEGPELVDMPAGAYVYPADETRRMMSAGGSMTGTSGGGTALVINLSVNVAAGANPVTAGQQILDVLVPALRTGGAGRLRRELGL